MLRAWQSPDGAADELDVVGDDQLGAELVAVQ
jgi:hypothetical protein